MVYLAGQVLVFVLVAMLVGAVLAWIFMIAPLRRVAAFRAGGQPVLGVPVGALGVADAASTGSDAAVADLTVRLRRQEDEWGLERADLTGRLATAEQQAAESERRVAAAEHQVAEAERRVFDIDRQLREVAVTPMPPDDDGGSVELATMAAAPGARPVATVADLARETTRLRDALADAEGRAAKFSSRLAMVRTEAEDAQRRVATMITRLDRHQAEWAAEKVRLLARLDDVENRRVEGRRAVAPPAERWREAAGGRVAGGEPGGTGYGGGAFGGSGVGDDPGRGVPGRGVPGLGGSGLGGDETVSGDGRPEPLDGNDDTAKGSLADLDGVVPVSRVPIGPLPSVATAAASPYPRTSALDAVVLSAGAVRRPLPGSDVLAGFVTSLRSDPPVDVAASVGSGARAAVAGSAVAGSAVRDATTRTRLRRQAGDNLREIVGVGPLVEARLHNLGITTYRQLAVMGEADVDWLTSKLDGLGSRIVSDDWVGQARDLQARSYGGQD